MVKASSKSSKRKTNSTRRQRSGQKVADATISSHATPSIAPVEAPLTVVEPLTVWQLLDKLRQHVSSHWRFWLKYIVLLAALNVLLVHNLGNDIATLKSQLASFLGANSAATGLGTYTLLLANNSTASGSAGVYQYILLIIGSLAAIWSLRQFMSDQPPATLRLRDSFYRGMFPLVPFVLVLIVLSLELIPVILTGTLYGIVSNGGIIRTWYEQVLFLVIFFAGLGVTIWLLMRSVFALYIVTLSDMTPLRALRDASQIVRGRQLNVIRKIVFLLVLLLVVSMALLLPVIFLVPVATQWVFFVLSMVALPFVHAYLYSFYRELLG